MKTAKNSVMVLGIIIFSIIACTDKQKLTTETKVSAFKFTSQNDLVKRGEYLVKITGCDDCHSPKIMTENGPEPDMSRRLSGYPQENTLPDIHQTVINPVSQGQWVLLSGDMTAAAGPWGVSFASNITPDDTGIGLWTEEQFIRCLRKGYYKGLEGSRPLMPPMPWQAYQNLSDEDLKAIFAYLKTIQPIRNIAPNWLPPARQDKSKPAN